MKAFINKLNPCYYETKLQRSIEWLTYGTECRCCIGSRIALAFLLGMLIGYAF